MILTIRTKESIKTALAMTVVCTVILSILAHGLSAVPLARLYAARVATAATLEDPRP